MYLIFWSKKNIIFIVKTIVKKNIILETKRHDFDNEFAYIEQWANSILKDCYLAEKEFLFQDGTLKSGGRKYFYSRNSDSPEKNIKQINFDNFDDFDNLYFINQDGEIEKIY